ncbi:MAG: redox-sensing transcriptional repressor Rex [Planctomycetota bacterium]|nr:redox-sensing transcriptional repressor Rex [Planctomycetota bacterium]
MTDRKHRVIHCVRVPDPTNIPRPTIKRLSLYLRELERHESDGRPTVNSRQLGASVGITDAQVRKDLSCFGQFGQPGIGYRVAGLAAEIRRILKVDREWNAIVVGAGNIGRAIMSYPRFGDKGFRIIAAFDAAPGQVGMEAGGCRVLPMEELHGYIREHQVQIAILSVPEHAAQDVATTLIDAGIRGILNFAPVRLDIGDGVEVTSVDVSRSLEQLTYQIAAAEA